MGPVKEALVVQLDGCLGMAPRVASTSWLTLSLTMQDGTVHSSAVSLSSRTDATARSLGPITLEGDSVRLEPLAERHLDGLATAAADPSVWSWLPTRSSRRPAFEAWFA